MFQKSRFSFYIVLIICFCEDVVAAKWNLLAPAEVKNMHAHTVQSCGEMDCSFDEIINCSAKCGCDKTIPYRLNVTSGECVLNLQTLLLSLAEKYKTQERNRKRTDRIFQGVMVSGIIVVTWASMCLFFACFYCFRIRYSDHQLRKSIKGAAKKLKEHRNANKTRLHDEKLEELELCKAAREAISVV